MNLFSRTLNTSDLAGLYTPVSRVKRCCDSLCPTDRLVDGEGGGPAVALVVRGGRLQVEADRVRVEVMEVTALPPRQVLAHHLGHLVLGRGVKHYLKSLSTSPCTADT